MKKPEGSALEIVHRNNKWHAIYNGKAFGSVHDYFSVLCKIVICITGAAPIDNQSILLLISIAPRQDCVDEYDFPGIISRE